MTVGKLIALLSQIDDLDAPVRVRGSDGRELEMLGVSQGITSSSVVTIFPNYAYSTEECNLGSERGRGI